MQYKQIGQLLRYQEPFSTLSSELQVDIFFTYILKVKMQQSKNRVDLKNTSLCYGELLAQKANLMFEAFK